MSIASPRRQSASSLTALASPVSERPLQAYVAVDGRTLPQRSFDEAVDEQGIPHGGDLEHALPLLASWTRSLDQTGGLACGAPANRRYQKLVEFVLRLARRDGSLALCDRGSIHAAQREVWRAAAKLVEPPLQRAMNEALRGLRSGSRSTTLFRKPADIPPPSANSATAGVAVLRPSWSSPRLAVDYRGTQLRMELDRDGETLLAGNCTPSVTIDGDRLSPQSGWEETCWVSDEDVDYLELQLALAGDVRIQRHLVFARADQCLFIADAVLGKRSGTIEYQTALPLAADVLAEAAAETREIALLTKGRRRAVVVPLALGEWRGERRLGELRAESDALQLTQSAADARNLFAPCFIDLAPRRLRRPVTWRRLTIAEDRQIQPNDVAVGYRVQVGSRQWLFYRSLDACGNRTVLGHNLVTEFLAARFSRDGVPETLIEIEAPAADDE